MLVDDIAAIEATYCTLLLIGLMGAPPHETSKPRWFGESPRPASVRLPRNVIVNDRRVFKLLI